MKLLTKPILNEEEKYLNLALNRMRSNLDSQDIA
jgi:hypothetical protein